MLSPLLARPFGFVSWVFVTVVYETSARVTGDAACAAGTAARAATTAIAGSSLRTPVLCPICSRDRRPREDERVGVRRAPGAGAADDVALGAGEATRPARDRDRDDAARQGEHLAREADRAAGEGRDARERRRVRAGEGHRPAVRADRRPLGPAELRLRVHEPVAVVDRVALARSL